LEKPEKREEAGGDKLSTAPTAATPEYSVFGDYTMIPAVEVTIKLSV